MSENKVQLVIEGDATSAHEAIKGTAKDLTDLSAPGKEAEGAVTGASDAFDSAARKSRGTWQPAQRETSRAMRATTEEVLALDNALAAYMSRIDGTYAAEKRLTDGQNLINRNFGVGNISAAQRARMLQSAEDAYGAVGNSAKLDEGLTALMSKLDPAYAKESKLSEATALLDANLAAGNISAAKHAAMMAKVEAAYGAAATGAKGLNFATAGAAREMTVLAHEALFNGNLNRMPGSMMVLAERTGGLGSVFAALASPAGIAALAITAVGVAAGVITYKIAKANLELTHLEAELQATGRTAQESRPQLENYVTQLNTLSGVNKEAADSIVEDFSKAPRIGSVLFDQLVRSVGDFAYATGQEAPAAAKELAKAFSDPTKGAQELDAQLDFLTSAQLRSIQTAQAQGDTYKAQEILFDALKDRIQGMSDNTLHFGEVVRRALAGWRQFHSDLGNTDDIEKASKAISDLIAKLRGQRNDGPVYRAQVTSVPPQPTREDPQRAIKNAYETSQQYLSLDERRKGIENEIATIDKGISAARANRDRVDLQLLTARKAEAERQLALVHLPGVRKPRQKSEDSLLRKGEDAKKMLAEVRDEYAQFEATASGDVAAENMAKLNSELDKFLAQAEGKKIGATPEARSLIDAAEELKRKEIEEKRAYAQKSLALDIDQKEAEREVQLASLRDVDVYYADLEAIRAKYAKARLQPRSADAQWAGTMESAELEKRGREQRKANSERNLGLESDLSKGLTEIYGTQGGYSVAGALAERGQAVEIERRQRILTLDEKRRQAEAAINEVHERTGDALTPQDQEELDAKQKELDLVNALIDVTNGLAAAKQRDIAVSRTWQSGLRSGFREYADDATNYATQAKNAVSDAFGGMEDALANFVVKGKDTWSDLVNTILMDLVKIQIRSSITGPLAKWLGGFSFLGSAHGNVLGGDGISALSNGVYSSPTYFGFDRHITAFARGGVLGEAGPEAVMPLTRDSSGNLGVRAAGGGGDSIKVDIHVSVPASSGNAKQDKTYADSIGESVSGAMDAWWTDRYRRAHRPGAMGNGGVSL